MTAELPRRLIFSLRWPFAGLGFLCLDNHDVSGCGKQTQSRLKARNHMRKTVKREFESHPLRHFGRETPVKWGFGYCRISQVLPKEPLSCPIVVQWFKGAHVAKTLIGPSVNTMWTSEG